MNKKGQALVEFIIILPIIILLLLAVFDVVNIYKTKMELESIAEDIVLDDTKVLDDNLSLLKTNDDKYITYTIKKNVDITSPFLSVIMDSPYPVTVKRVVSNE